MGHARALLSLDEYQQIVFATEIIKKGFSVRETEKYVSVKKSKNTPLITTTSKDPNTISLEREVSEILGAITEIKHNKQGKGKMVIRYKSLDILQGILEKIKN